MSPSIPTSWVQLSPTAKLLILAVLTLATAIYSIGLGAISIGPLQIIAIFAELFGLSLEVDYPEHYKVIIFSIRLPRVILACLVGANLALAGAALQSLFRNPLADPTLIGVSSGAGLGAGIIIVFGDVLFGAAPWFQPYALPVAAFCGGLATAFVIYRIGFVGGRTYVATMLLAGIGISSIAGALISLMSFLSDDQQLRDLTFWLMGSMGRSTWAMLLPAMPFFLLSLLGLSLQAKHLNLMTLGESMASSMGLHTERLKVSVLLFSSLAVGTSVALTGIIGFVGLVVPHLIRFVVGPDNRVLFPASILLGSILALVADNLARTIVVPAELPIGIITSCVGGPFFIWLLVQRRGLAVAT